MIYARIACISALVSLAASAHGSNSDIAIEHVNVIPMTHEVVLPDQTVVIRDGKIDAIGPSGDIKAPRRAETIDGSGKYLIPGLNDLHVHFNGGSNSNPDMLALYLANGVTTVLNMRGNRGMLDIRDKVNDGELLGPTVYTTSPILGNTSADPSTYEIGRDMVQQFHDEGYDWIKVYNQIPAEGYRGVMETAKRLGMPVVGHAVRSVGIEGALAYGQHIAHMEEIIYGYFGKDLDESKIPALAQRFKEANICVIATLTAFHNIIKQMDDLDAMLHSPGMEYLHPRITRTWQPDTNEYTTHFTQKDVETFLGPAFAFQQKLVKQFTDAGVSVLTGTDASIPVVVPGYSLHQELEEFVDAGLTPYQALAASTVKSAAFLGREDCGTIEPGKRADLVLIDANPLYNIGNTRKIAGTVIGGTWLDRNALQESLDQIRASIQADQ